MNPLKTGGSRSSETTFYTNECIYFKNDDIMHTVHTIFSKTCLQYNYQKHSEFTITYPAIYKKLFHKIHNSFGVTQTHKPTNVCIYTTGMPFGNEGEMKFVHIVQKHSVHYYTGMYLYYRQ